MASVIVPEHERPADELPLTVPVAVVVMEALECLESLTRDESYLLERLRRADDSTAALLLAIKDAPPD